MIRPLYLDAAIPWQVRLDDGPTLNVSAPGRARSLYPLRRLARVLSPCGAQWSTEALLACLRHGVPIVFHDSAGEPVGWCFGPRKRETTLTGLIREALDQPNWAEIFGTWERATHRREILGVLRGLGVSSRSLEPTAVRARLCNLHRIRFGRPARAWINALCRASAALVAEHLHGAVGDPALIGFAREGLHLAKTTSGLLEWRLHRILHAQPAAELDGALPDRFAAAMAGRHATGLSRACGELIGSLEHHLRERLT